MAVTIYEVVGSPRAVTGVSSRSFEYDLLCVGSDDMGAIIEAVEIAYSKNRTIIGEFWERQPISATPIEDQGDSQSWSVTVRYGAPKAVQPRAIGDMVFRFSTGGGTTRVSQAKENIGNYALSGTPPDFEGAMNVVGDGPDQRVEGVDIVTPNLEFTITKYFEYESITTATMASWSLITGTTNDAIFFKFPIGTILFLGVDGQARGTTDWELTFRFAASPNRSSLTVGGITGILKGGWHYLWTRFGKVADPASNQLVERVTSVHVDRTYDPADFSVFGLENGS